MATSGRNSDKCPGQMLPIKRCSKRCANSTIRFIADVLDDGRYDNEFQISESKFKPPRAPSDRARRGARPQRGATDTWNFYQAKSIKKSLYAIAAVNPGPEADGFKKLAERYGKDEQELFLTVAVTLLHVAIAIATIAIIVRGQHWPWYTALALGAVGSIGAAQHRDLVGKPNPVFLGRRVVAGRAGARTRQ